MKLKLPPFPFLPDREIRYTTHCTNIARIIAHSSNPDHYIKEYIKITGVELEEEKPHE